MKNIVFCTEASEKVGMGHLMECISLAENLKKGAECNITFLTKNFLPAIDILKRKGYRVETLREEISKEEEINLMLQLIKKLKVEVLICDLLDKNIEYFQTLKAFIKTLVVILDDARHRAVPGDIVVNFNIAQDVRFYKELPDNKTLYCIGPKYMLLPEELHSEWRKEKIISETCQTIFVNQGGSDPFGLTAKIIRALELLDLKQKIIVVVGHAISYEHKRELGYLEPQLKNNYQFEWGITQERMHQLLAESDIAITAAGNTLYELAVFGVPSIVICHHEKHNLVAQKFVEKNAVINLGIGTNLEIHTIAEAVNNLLRSKENRSELSANIKRIVDGFGSKRVAKKVLTA